MPELMIRILTTPKLSTFLKSGRGGGGGGGGKIGTATYGNHNTIICGNTSTQQTLDGIAVMTTVFLSLSFCTSVCFLRSPV